MSELTLCNYCSLQRIKRDAKKKGKRVIVKIGGHDDSLGYGVDVYIIEKGGKPSEKNKVCWFMTLTDKCAC